MSIIHSIAWASGAGIAVSAFNQVPIPTGLWLLFAAATFILSFMCEEQAGSC